MKNTILCTILLLTFVVAVPTHAQLGSQSFGKFNFKDNIITKAEIEVAETTFSNPGILPDDPFYFLKEARENIQLMFTFDLEQRARLHLDLAKTRLAEAKVLAEKNRPNSVTIDRFNTELLEFNNSISNIGENVPGIMKDGEAILERSNILLNFVLSKTTGKATGVKRIVEETTKTNEYDNVDSQDANNENQDSKPPTQGQHAESSRVEQITTIVDKVDLPSNIDIRIE